ncbi:phosphoglucosamine mutase [candidate division KSB1 bacterium]|nr:phosphoglucosamine mutase [candidate division KSB1 bacterium]
MSRLMVSVSGIRGIIGEGLTPSEVIKYTQAFGTYVGSGKVVVGRDSRVTGEMVKSAVISGLLAVGCDVIDIGICPTPTVQMAVEKLKARGGIAVTASHNPIEWNALKLIDSSGLFVDEEQGKKVIEYAEKSNFNYVIWEKIGKIDHYKNAIQDHINAILKLKYIDPDLIRSKEFKVVADCVNGAGGTTVPQLLRELNCDVITINEEPNGLFPRAPEPVPENLSELCEKVKSVKADIGFAVDPDVDRLAVVSENGVPLGEEYTLALAVNYIAQKKRGPIVVNASVSKVIDDLAEKYHSKVIRTKVGEIHVATRMRKENAAIGGEGNGGVILPELHLGRDAPLGIALTLQQLAEFGGKISDLQKKLPQYYQVKRKINLDQVEPEQVMEKIVDEFSDEKIDRTDGIKILWDNEWVHIRPSNTEPIIRVMSEAKTQEQAEAICYKFMKFIEGI